jgi:hypothetical protein
MRSAIFPIVLLWCAGASGIDAFLSGDDLLRLCESESVSERGECMGYLEAVIDSIIDNKDSLPTVTSETDWIFNDACPPSGPHSIGTIQIVWVTWARANPELLHHAAHGLLIRAFAEAWPCS